MLVLSSFSNGGEVSNITVYEWVLPADEDPGLDNLGGPLLQQCRSKVWLATTPPTRAGS